tara:strand:- start:854 stop:1141 length:288 start_codon:yes stop_codon:yes gene_type:complete
MSNGGITQFLPLILIFIIFYFFLIRPQQKKAKDHKNMVSAIKRGDKIITSGGIFATVERVMDNDKVEVSVSDNVNVELVKSTGIQALVSNTEQKK